MSLQVWLPLNGNLKNQGARGDISITNNGATVSSGKVTSNCYSFNGSNQYLQLSKTLGSFYNSDFSLTVWLKPLVAKRGIILSEYQATGASNVAFELASDLRLRVWWNSNPDIYTTEKLSVNVWSHIAITKTSNQILFYINGNLVYTHNQSSGFSERISTALARIGDDYRSGTDVDYNGMINDFRLYNHCLSVKEVKELAKGLMVHYTLSRPCDNLAKNTYLNRVTTPLYSVGDTTYGRNRITILDEGKQNSTTYTISAKVKTNGNRNIALYYYEANWTGGYGTNTGWQTTNGEWKIIKASFTTKSDQSSKTIYMEFYSQTSTTDGEAYVEWFKLEKGNKATPWIPNSADTLYSAMGLNSTTESDVTGYGNNATKTNINSRNSDTARYITSMVFNGSNSYLRCLDPIKSTTTEFTISAWVYLNNVSSTMCLWNGRTTAGVSVALFIVNTNMYFDDSTRTTVTAELTANTWIHIVGTWKSGGKKTLYVNGVSKSSVNAGTLTKSNNYATIGLSSASDATPASNPFNGRMSDFRIYATALSAEDILELYHTSASIDKNGNMHCYELVEV